MGGACTVLYCVVVHRTVLDSTALDGTESVLYLVQPNEYTSPVRPDRISPADRHRDLWWHRVRRMQCACAQASQGCRAPVD